MSKNTPKNESRAESFKNEATRQRWNLFHQAIAHAKQTNVSSLEEAGDSDVEERRPLPLQSAAS